ncbi:MAG: type 1 glutamine amidotransferase [Chitinispirillaceae bacterium]|nr:type 1 glutamine amidotransferase [Chitinispirillaceae bacterium]
MKRIHYLQHAPFETPAYILDLCERYQCPVTGTRVWETTDFPDPAAFDLLVVMGGPMNIYEHETYPWLIEEKIYLPKVIDADKLVLGICLGSQLLADALGGSVVKNRCKEIGWFPVRMTHGGMDSPLMRDIPEIFTPFHWHGDTYPPPPGTLRLASSAACDNQGFIFDNHVVGLQFHLEMTAESTEELIKACSNELIIDEYVHPAVTIREDMRRCLTDSQKIMEQLFVNMIT